MPVLETVLDGRVIERREITTNQYLQEAIGQALRRYRLSAGLTLEVVAERSGVSTGAISRLERGDVDPKFTTLVRIIKALEVPHLYEPFELLVNFENLDLDGG